VLVNTINLRFFNEKIEKFIKIFLLKKSNEKCDWSCCKNFIKKKILLQTLFKPIPLPKEGDEDPRGKIKRFLHSRDTEH